MPRKARTYLPNYPYHIVQRDNNRQAVYFGESDYSYYLHLMEDLLPKYGVALHAYVLMTNHIHLLVTPVESDSISRFTRVLGSRYAQYINKTHKRTGTLWEGRHKSSVIDAESYLLKCYRYIELNPVAANMVARPDEYLWSSFGVNGWGDDWGIVTPHSEYVRLGATTTERCSAYKTLFKVNLSEMDLQAFRSAAHYCHPVGDDRFKRQIELETATSVGYAKRGRPKRAVDNVVKI